MPSLLGSHAQEHAEQIDDEVKAVLPVDAVDVLAHNQRVLNFTFVVDPESVASKDNRKPIGSNLGDRASTFCNWKAMLLANRTYGLTYYGMKPSLLHQESMLMGNTCRSPRFGDCV